MRSRGSRVAVRERLGRGARPGAVTDAPSTLDTGLSSPSELAHTVSALMSSSRQVGPRRHVGLHRRRVSTKPISCGSTSSPLRLAVGPGPRVQRADRRVPPAPRFTTGGPGRRGGYRAARGGAVLARTSCPPGAVDRSNGPDHDLRVKRHRPLLTGARSSRKANARRRPRSSSGPASPASASSRASSRRTLGHGQRDANARPRRPRLRESRARSARAVRRQSAHQPWSISPSASTCAPNAISSRPSGPASQARMTFGGQ